MTADTRRGFLKKSLSTTIFLIFLKPFSNIFANAHKPILPPLWTDLIDYARWCPTVHNLQPHKVKIISATEAELYYDPARLLPIGDPNAIFVTVAMGIFHEHLSIAASHTQHIVEMSNYVSPISTAAKGLTFFATLHLKPSLQKEILPRDLIKKRRTARLHYNAEPLKKETLDQLREQAAQFEHEFFSSTDEALIDFVIDLNQQTLFQDISLDADRKELDKLFRYSKKQAKEQKDGLWSKCMGFPGLLMKSVFQHSEKWKKGLMKQLLAKHYQASFKGTATLGWFGGRFNDTQDWLQAGRMLARSWLLVTKNKAYIQPFGSLITNAKAYQKINERFSQPGSGKKIWMIFRAGYSSQPARSFRLNTSDIIIT